MVTPAARRDAVAHAVEIHGMSERRACTIMAVDRSSVRYRSVRPDDAGLRARLRELADQRRRFGYRRLHVLLRQEGHGLMISRPPAHEIPDSPAKKVIKLLRALETYVAGHASMIIDYATARKQSGPISTATTESTVQRLLHRRMGANQQMRWSPRGAHLMLKVRTAVMNDTFAKNHAAEMLARRPYLRAA